MLHAAAKLARTAAAGGSLQDFVAETDEEREMRQYGGLSAAEQAMINEATEASRDERELMRAVQVCWSVGRA